MIVYDWFNNADHCLSGVGREQAIKILVGILIGWWGLSVVVKQR